MQKSKLKDAEFRASAFAFLLFTFPFAFYILYFALRILPSAFGYGRNPSFT